MFFRHAIARLSVVAFLLSASFSEPVPPSVSAAEAAAHPVFEQDILPILEQRCGNCHNDQAREGGLSLDSYADLLEGGDSAESLISESADESLLWIMVDEGGMPPEDEPPLQSEEKKLIHKWLETGAATQSGSKELVVTQHDILPIFYTRCVVCHGGKKTEAGLDLRSVEGLREGGKSGPAIVPGDSEASLVLKKIRSKDMPPPREIIKAGVRPFEPNEIELLAQWIDQGAREFDIRPDVQTAESDPMVTESDRDFWAFRTPRQSNVPPLPEDSTATGATPVDRFLLRKLSEQDLTFSAEADRQTLIRRVAFDLTGLSPKWEDVERFQNDESGDWYAKLVDFYLNSPHYGERWGRYWLDLCGYADSEGKRSADPIREHAWRYRDYVIRSLNEDKPYDRFLVEQLAGDELYDFKNADAVTDEMMDALIATGFLRMAPDGTGSDIVDTVAERFEVVADEIEVLGSSVMGLTLKCAQCHSHKYDPIPQRDYYRLVAVFQGAYDVYDWLKPTSVRNQSKQENPRRRFLPYVTDEVTAKWREANRPIKKQIAAAEQELKATEAEYRTKLFEGRLKSLKKLSDENRAELDALIKRDSSGAIRFDGKPPAELPDKLKETFRLSSEDLAKQFGDLKKKQRATGKKIKKLKGKLRDQPMIRALWDRGDPSPTWIFRRGEFTNPGDLVGPGVLSVLSDGRTPFATDPKRPGSTGRRLAFAQWLTDEQHPLTARVIVNRVWHHHFGRGIVETVSNFGKTGTPPTHPELLDWLAVSFMENGWSLKWLHREIMNTRAYRQSSLLRPESEMRDPDNRWLSRMPLKRLEAEAVRDSLLYVSGALQAERFGRPDPVTVRDDGLVTSNEQDSGWRRTIYVRQRRKEIPTILEAFDLPQMNPNCVERPSSTVASQALHLLNNGMIRDLADRFADDVEAQAGNDRYRQVEHVYRKAFGRNPTAEEMQLALESLSRLTAHWEQQAEASDGSDEQAGESQGNGKGKGEKDSNPDRPSDAASKALTNFCHVILNSAEFIFVD